MWVGRSTGQFYVRVTRRDKAFVELWTGTVASFFGFGIIASPMSLRAVIPWEEESALFRGVNKMHAQRKGEHADKRVHFLRAAIRC